MKFFGVVLVLILSGPALAERQAQPDSEVLKAALEKQTTCANFVRYDEENIYLGFGGYRHAFEEPRSPIPATLKIASVANPTAPVTLDTSDAAIDTVRDGDSLFVLTYSGIEEWSLVQKARVATYPSYAINGPLAYMQHAQAFARSGDRVIVAHGRLGVSFFDLKTRRLVNQFRLAQDQGALESMATGVSIAGPYAYVVMDNFSLVSEGKPAFRGVVIINMETQKVVAALDGLDPGADAAASDGLKLIVSFSGRPIWKYGLDSLRGRELPQPERRIWLFPFKGSPTGRPAIDAKYYYTCFSKAPETPGGRYTNVPLALDRHAIGLD